jgi:hypothetical protein
MAMIGASGSVLTATSPSGEQYGGDAAARSVAIDLD